MVISRIKVFCGHLWSFVYLRLYEAAEHFIELRKRRRKSNLKLTDGSDTCWFIFNLFLIQCVGCLSETLLSIVLKLQLSVVLKSQASWTKLGKSYCAFVLRISLQWHKQLQHKSLKSKWKLLQTTIRCLSCVLWQCSSPHRGWITIKTRAYQFARYLQTCTSITANLQLFVSPFFFFERQ